MSDPRNQRNPTQKQIYSINKTPEKEKKEREKKHDNFSQMFETTFVFKSREKKSIHRF